MHCEVTERAPHGAAPRSSYLPPAAYTTSPGPIVCQRYVHDGRIPGFVTRHFREFAESFTELVCDTLYRLATVYPGIFFWESYELSNGGCFVAPLVHQMQTLRSGKGSTVYVTMQSAGIAVCLIAIGDIAAATGNVYVRDQQARLLAYARQLVEWYEIEKVVAAHEARVLSRTRSCGNGARRAA